MTKIDLRKDLKHLYKPSAKSVATVDVPPMRFLMVDGQGDPNKSTEYAALGAPGAVVVVHARA